MSDATDVFPTTTESDSPTDIGEKIDVLEPGEIVTTLDAGDDAPELTAGDDDVLPAGDSTDPADTPAGDQKPQATFDPNTLIALQGIINRQSAKLDELKDDAKKLSESVKSIVENDQELSQIEEQAKEIVKLQKERKQSLANSPESTQLKLKIKDIKESIKDLEESLNNHLLNFYQMTGVKVFDTDDGSTREFEVRAKLRSKKKAA